MTWNRHFPPRARHPGTPEQQALDRAHNATRSAPGVKPLYGSEWQRLSRAIRVANPHCVVCGTPERLTVDHVTLHVVCRAHLWTDRNGGVRGAIEAHRRS